MKPKGSRVPAAAALLTVAAVLGGVLWFSLAHAQWSASRSSSGLVNAGPAAAAGVTTRVSVNSVGTEGNDSSALPAISGDGRFVAFVSGASNLVMGDTNGFKDVFVHDRETAATERVSVDSAGKEGNGASEGLFSGPAISGDGRLVVFDSQASNLVAGDTNGFNDIFLHDRQTGETERVSLNSAANEANGSSYSPTVSADGRYVAFSSIASNLVAGDTNGFNDIFLHDRQTGATERVSIDSGGNEANGNSADPAISGDGRFVAFLSWASNLVSGDTNTCEPHPGPGTCPDIFVHDRQAGTTERVSVDSAGNQANGDSYLPAISADGRNVAFYSFATNLVPGDTNVCGILWCPDIFVHDRQTGTTERVSVDSAGGQANGASWPATISADGRHVAFVSRASNLVTGDTNGFKDVFVHDRQAGATERVSVDSSGAQANGHSGSPAISADGRFVAFASYATNLVPGDTNGAADVFVHDRGEPGVIMVDIDIKPGGDPNSTNLGSRGVIPVAILSAPDFDAASVDPATVRFEGAAALHDGLEDVDGDGDVDLIMHFRTQEAEIADDATEACLTGETFDGQPIEGCDTIRIVPPSLDSDGDGFGDAVEATVGTDQSAACPTGPGHDAWPPDFDRNTVVNILDVGALLPPTFGGVMGDDTFTWRKDLLPDGVINILDVGMTLPPIFGSVCTP